MGEGRQLFTGTKISAGAQAAAGTCASRHAGGRWTAAVRLYCDPVDWFVVNERFPRPARVHLGQQPLAVAKTAGTADVQALAKAVSRLEQQNSALMSEVTVLHQEIKDLYALIETRLPQHPAVWPAPAPSSAPSPSRRWQWSRLQADAAA